MRKFISGPTIAALTASHRMTINDAMRAGRFGPTYRCGRIVYVALDRVEKPLGITFTDEQTGGRVGGAAGSRRHN